MKQISLSNFVIKKKKTKRQKFVIQNKGINFIKETYKNTLVDRNHHFICKKHKESTPIIAHKVNAF